MKQTNNGYNDDHGLNKDDSIIKASEGDKTKSPFRICNCGHEFETKESFEVCFYKPWDEVGLNLYNCPICHTTLSTRQEKYEKLILNLHRITNDAND